MRAAAAALAGALAAALTALAALGAEPRVALVIGVQDYETFRKLANPVRDAEHVAKALRAVGFDVEIGRNLDKDEMARAITGFRRRLDEAGPTAVGLVYFSGHGVQWQGQAFLIPVDANPRDDLDLPDHGFRLERIFEQIKAINARETYVVIDACRDQPLPKSSGLFRTAAEGYPAVSAPSAKVKLLFSAQPGARATDGAAGEVSPFAAAFAEAAALPGKSSIEAFSAVTNEVVKATKGVQVPRFEGALYGERFCFAGCELDDAPPPPPVKPAPAIDPDAAAWSAVARDCDAKAYLAAFPKGAYAAAAAIRAGRCDEAARPKPGDPVDEPPGRSEPARFSVSADGKPVVDGATVTAATPAGTVFKDCADCPEMIVIPAGAFLMGSPASESGRGEDEDDAPGAGGRPRRVTFPRAFAVGKFEVTWAEWEACVAARACDQGPVDKAGGDYGWGKGARPVINVSWNDAKAYAAWLSAKTGQRYRLLSEAEWEYAARAGTTGRFSNDGAEAQLCQIANHADQSVSYGWKNTACRDGVGEQTAPVGRFAVNPFGLHDMHGNVWEWVEDCYADSYSAGQPSDGSAYTTSSCSSRVVRGGSWYDDPIRLRSAVRHGSNPAVRSIVIGFRLARTVSP